MAIFQTENGAVELADPLVHAVARNAAFVADLTAAVLDKTGIFPPATQKKLPAGFLLELGAVLQIGFWERNGIVVHQSAGLPSYREASKDLAARAERGPAEFADPAAISLSRAVMAFWIEHFAWEGKQLLGSDIVVDEVEEDQFADMLAEFLWKHRHQLSGFLEKGEGHVK